MARVMITNGNNVHAPDYHAEVTAEKITLLAETASAETISATRDLRKKFEAILTSHHQGAHDAEQSALKTEGVARYKVELDATPHVNDGLVKQLVAAAVGTPLEAHFAKPEVQAAILSELHHETRSQMNVHRLVHARAAELAKS